MARCLVLGANGFIGSHLVDELANAGHFVRCFDRYKSKNISFENRHEHNIEIFRGDFLSTHSLEQALDNIDYVFHFISSTNPYIAENDPVLDIDTNVKMSVELFKLCASKNIKKVIFASTGGAIYGNVNFGSSIEESTYPKPISPYAIGKLSIENYLRYFKVKHDLSYTVLRISNPYGPRQNTLTGQGVISIFLEKLKNNEPLTIYGDGSMVRDYIYIADAVKMIAGCCERDNGDDVYNLGAGKGTSVQEIVDTIEAVTGITPKVTRIETPSTFVNSVILNVNKFKNEFHISPDTNLKTGIELTWQALNQPK